MKNRDNIKKRMMFIKGEDYNFLTYNIFIILNTLNCINDKSSLKDHRKLSFLIDFIADSKLIDIIEPTTEADSYKINTIDKELLNQSYTNSLLRIKTINQLVFTLINEDFLILKDKKLDRLNISLNKDKISPDFFKNKVFTIETNNLKRLKKTTQRISSIDVSTMLNKLYFKHGVFNEQLIN